MISNFDGESAPGNSDGSGMGPLPPSMEAFIAELKATAKGVPLSMLKLQHSLPGMMTDAEREFVARASSDGDYDMLSNGIDGFMEWYRGHLHAGNIPSDWPAPNFEHEPGPGRLVPSDWATLVLATSGMLSTEGTLDMMPSSYDEVMFNVWESKKGVVLMWDGVRKAGQLVLNKRKAELLAIRDACRNDVLVSVVASEGQLLAGRIDTIMLRLMQVLKHVVPGDSEHSAVFEEIMQKSGIPTGDFHDCIKVARLSLAHLLTLQVPTIVTRRIAVYRRDVSDGGESSLPQPYVLRVLLSEATYDAAHRDREPLVQRLLRDVPMLNTGFVMAAIEGIDECVDDLEDPENGYVSGDHCHAWVPLDDETMRLARHFHDRIQ